MGRADNFSGVDRQNAGPLATRVLLTDSTGGLTLLGPIAQLKYGQSETARSHDAKMLCAAAVVWLLDHLGVERRRASVV